jgi:hypothetical protein
MVLCLLALALAGTANAQQASVRQAHGQQQAIQYAEPVTLSLKSSEAQFDAYGRRFSLSLSDNQRVLQKLSTQRRAELASYKLLRGSLAGAPGSWVRLTGTPDGVEGAIWDGKEFYAVTRYANIAPFLTTPLSAAPEQTVVYRLSDARNLLPQDFCALTAVAEAQDATTLDQYNAIVHAIEPGVIAPSITRQIEISLIADNAFQQAESTDPAAAMLARLNIVEGIFSEQLGLLVLATDVRLMMPEEDPFTSTKGTTLLEQLSAYRSATPAVRSRGLAHLMTGKDLDGTTAGIAYVRTACDLERGVSLSQRSYGTTISALIMAHELGHNLGASHDSEPGTPCASTGAGFIMASAVTGHATFSQCSLDTMKAAIASASCVTPAQYADVTVDPEVSSVSGEGGLPFSLPFTVHSTGNVGAQDAQIKVTLPASAYATIESAGATHGSCSVSGLTATCELGALDVGSSAQVNVVARGSRDAIFTAQATVSASNDRLTSNNNRQLQVTLRSGIDARLALSASADEVDVGAPLEVFADVSSLRAMAVSNATLSLSLNQPVISATLPGGSCKVNASSVVCSIAEIPSGATRRLTVKATTQIAGALFASASVGAVGDGDLTNNHASTTGWVQAARDVELTSPVPVVDLDIGAIHEIPYTLRARGRLPTGDVTLLLTLPAALVVDSLDAGGITCTQPSTNAWRCEMGPMAPGTTRAVNLRVHAEAPFQGNVLAVAAASDDDYGGNNTANLLLRVDHLVDLAVTMASGGSGVEDARLEGQVALRSNGRQTISQATLDIELHSAGRLTSAAIHNGAACTLISETRARCAVPALARHAQLYIDYSAEFAEPGTYEVTFLAAAPADSAPDNDRLVRAVLVRPYLDAAVSGSLTMNDFLGGQARVRTFTLSTDRRGLASARLLAAHAPPALFVEAISASTGECRVDAALGGVCEFTDLPANASVPVSVTYRAADGSWMVDPVVSVSTPGDVVSGNDSLSGRVETIGGTDLELRVAATINGTKSATLDFPLIELVNGDSKAITPRLEVTLPPEITVVDVSATDGMCSGTTILRCDFNTLEPSARASVSLSVRSSASGSFVSEVRVTSINDINVANDTRNVAMEIVAPSVAATSGPSGGGGGGGRMQWLALLFLALLAGARWTLRGPLATANPSWKRRPRECRRVTTTAH